MPHTVSSLIPNSTTPQRLFRRFEQERMALLSSISGLPTSEDCSRYASLLLRRLMVLSFLQEKGFLDHNLAYLSLQFSQIHAASGEDAFFHTCLLPLFDTLASSSHSRTLPGLALPLFAPCSYEIEMAQGSLTLTIPNTAFKRLLAFLDTFEWSLAPQSQQSAHILGPAILASLFEHQINQKQMGAYYTHSDVTLYTVTNTLISSLFTSLTQHSPAFFAPAGPLLSLLQTTPERYMQAILRVPNLLPTETERDFLTRQQRSEQLFSHLQQGQISSVADLISANLNLQRLLLDLIEMSDNPAFVLQVYCLLSQTTLLDPTCGSGAFLLAALSLLQPLYSACLTRLHLLRQETSFLLSPDQQHLYEALCTTLATAPNQLFFVTEQSITYNLYGIDIMDEAVEICQLCLFLALIASVEQAEDLPLFSHLSFHIRAGNALVGFVTLPDMPSSDERDLTPSLDRSSLIVQRYRLDALLAHRHGALSAPFISSPDDFRGLEKWSALYRPFHWFLEFPECLQKGGFSVIIGNPPFIEYRKNEYGRLFSDYQTQMAGNLYALVMERALQLCRRDDGFMGLLVPLSLCSAERFALLRSLLLSQTAHLWLANFAIFPCRLFEGSFQRLSLVFAHISTGQLGRLETTRMLRWYTLERPFLLAFITYTPVHLLSTGTFPKLTSPLQEGILMKVLARVAGRTLGDLLVTKKTSSFVYYQEATNYWAKATCIIPYYKKNGKEKHPAHGRTLYFAEQVSAWAIMAVMNSSLFYLWFATYGDGFHLTHALVTSFPINDESAFFRQLARLAELLHTDIQRYAQRSTRNTRASQNTQSPHKIELEEFHMGRSKSLLDDIDAILAQYYGFTGEELDFIVNYDEKYRVGS